MCDLTLQRLSARCYYLISINVTWWNNWQYEIKEKKIKIWMLVEFFLFWWLIIFSWFLFLLTLVSFSPHVSFWIHFRFQLIIKVEHAGEVRANSHETFIDVLLQMDTQVCRPTKKLLYSATLCRHRIPSKWPLGRLKTVSQRKPWCRYSWLMTLLMMMTIKTEVVMFGIFEWPLRTLKHFSEVVIEMESWVLIKAVCLPFVLLVLMKKSSP